MDGPTCLSCRIVSGVETPPGGAIAATPHFHAHQDVAYPVEGQVIVAARRHFHGLDAMAPSEAADLLPFLQAIRRAQREVLGIRNVYYFYNEDTKHHFHAWMVPRHDWIVRFGRSIEAVRPALLHARSAMSSPAELDAVRSAAGRLREALRSP